jgi:hypothetical protein
VCFAAHFSLLRLFSGFSSRKKKNLADTVSNKFQETFFSMSASHLPYRRLSHAYRYRGYTDGFMGAIDSQQRFNKYFRCNKKELYYEQTIFVGTFVYSRFEV